MPESAILTPVLVTARYHPEKGWSDLPERGLDSHWTLVLAFGARRYLESAGPLVELDRRFPNSHLVGCSTAGEIFEDQLADDTITAAVFRFKKTMLRTASATVQSAADSREAGRGLGSALAANDLRGVFLLSDGLNVNGSELVRGLQETLPRDVIVTGGLAADGDRFERTWVLCDGRPRERVVVAVGFYGPSVQIGHGSRGGWDVFGPSRKVTRSEGNVLYELDGRPALTLYKTYLGERAAQLPSSALLFPLAVRPADGSDKSLVRTVLSVCEERQSMTFAGDIPVGWSAQLMRANFDRLVSAAGESSAGAAAGFQRDDGSAALSIAISCVGRRLILGERTEEELEAAREALLPGDRQVGFYSYGELSPAGSGPCELHNQTMTITTLSER